MADGILVIDKAADWTSMDVCAKLRGIFHERRVGHAGTLDPMATGVLPVFLGRATRAVEFAAEGEKEYFAGLRLGMVTDTQDTTGAVLKTAPVHASRAEVEACLNRFRGDILQVPPMYSAIKKDGKKLYELARKGQEVERAPRPVTIYALEILEQTGETEYRLRVRCSKGTYIRTLCHEIGAALGCGGTMSSLRRSAAAGFTLAQAVTLDAVRAAAHPEEFLLPVDSYFSALPALTVDEPTESRIRNGNAIPWRAEDGEYRVYGPGGAFLMLGRCAGNKLTTVKSFFPV